MKELDCVEIIVEKKVYAREGVHIGMQGWICLEECSTGYWLVNFPQYGAKKNIATISVHEDDIKIIPGMDARVNERIKEEYENTSASGDRRTNDFEVSGELSGYMI